MLGAGLLRLQISCFAWLLLRFNDHAVANVYKHERQKHIPEVNSTIAGPAGVTRYSVCTRVAQQKTFTQYYDIERVSV